jgi:hypothetical protein
MREKVGNVPSQVEKCTDLVEGQWSVVLIGKTENGSDQSDEE